MYRKAFWAILLLVLLLAAVQSSAQIFWAGGRGARARLPRPESFDGRYNFCRLIYQSGYRELGGSGWSTDYPGADMNFPIRLGELTKTPVNFTPRGESNFLTIPIMHPLLFRCPWVIAEDVGTAVFDDDEIERLRSYLLKGGFLWADDFWGSDAWESWEYQIGRIFPPGEFPIVDIPRDHVIWRTLFEIQKIPQIPAISHWRRTGGETSERGADSAEVHFRAINDDQGRIMVLMTHNTDIADGWEREGEDPQYFYRFSPDSYALAINVMMYMMSH